jgi:hypothetical protein
MKTSGAEAVSLLIAADDKYEAAAEIDDDSPQMSLDWGNLLAYWAYFEATNEVFWSSFPNPTVIDLSVNIYLVWATPMRRRCLFFFFFDFE